jgi:hypothetical protein
MNPVRYDSRSVVGTNGLCMTPEGVKAISPGSCTHYPGTRKRIPFFFYVLRSIRPQRGRREPTEKRCDPVGVGE